MPEAGASPDAIKLLIQRTVDNDVLGPMCDFFTFAAAMANNKKYLEQIKNNPGSVVEQIVKEVVGKKAVDVHFEEDDDAEWAMIKVYNEDEDQEMAIRLQSGDKWVLQFGYYDDDDEFIELLQPLGQLETDLIPQGLQKVMRKVLASEEGLRLPGSLLVR